MGQPDLSEYVKKDDLTEFVKNQQLENYAAKNDLTLYQLKGDYAQNNQLLNYQTRGNYSFDTHNHDDLYSAKVHNHDDLYSVKAHAHDTLYANIIHNHDDKYYTRSETDTRFDKTLVCADNSLICETPRGKDLKISGRFCIGDVCLNGTDMSKLIKYDDNIRLKSIGGNTYLKATDTGFQGRGMAGTSITSDNWGQWQVTKWG